MEFDNEKIMRFENNLDCLIKDQIGVDDICVLKYTAGLRALLDVLPDDTETLSDETVENYLWVIELLLNSIYHGLETYSGKEA